MNSITHSKWQRWKGIMKCYPFEEKRLAKWEPPFIVQAKFDGVRCRSVPTDNYSLLLSSEENIIYSVPHINEAIEKAGLTNIELDGELYCHGMSFEQIVAITSRTVNLHSDRERIKFHVFDIVNEDYQMQRTIALRKLEGLNPWIKITPYHVCYNLDDVLKAYDKIVSAGYEGIIVRNAYARYIRKRSVWVMKFKPKQEDSYEIVGTQEEISIDGVPKDRLGALVCKSGDGNIFNVGTGFDDEQRDKLWDIRGILPGNIAVIKFQHITSGKQVPRFPVFVEVKFNV